MVAKTEEVTTIRLVEETIKKVVCQIRDNLLTKVIKQMVVQVEEEEMEENLIKFIFITTIVKNIAIIQINIEEAEKIKKVMQSLQKTK